MAPRLPLPTLLSQVLVAFTIELDNEFERQMPHRTSMSPGGPPGAPWLVSRVMWSNLLQYVGEEGITVAALQKRARIEKLSLAGMERWGYIVVAPDPGDPRPKPPQRDWVVRLTDNGRRAQQVWRPLSGVIEARWVERFGEDAIGGLRESLRALVSRIDRELPEYLPVLGFGLFSEVATGERSDPSVSVAADANLETFLSRLLLAFTVEFERGSDLSLAISANVIRLLGDAGVRVRDLPRLAGVSKEAMKVALGFLEKGRYVVVGPDPGAPGTKLVRLTQKGLTAQKSYEQRLSNLEERWQEKFGQIEIRDLRGSLERLVGESTAEILLLFSGLEPYPEGWRAAVRKPDTLPHFPMVLHRGGYPDGS